MERTANERPLMKVPMDRMLESAVILSWEDLPHDFEPGLIHIEYSLEVSLDYVKIWQVNRQGNLETDLRIPGVASVRCCTDTVDVQQWLPF